MRQSTQSSVHFSKRQLQAAATIIFRNVFLFGNGIIFAVVILLTTFGDTEEGIFLGFITVLNIILGCVQEIGAWLTLEKLQLLTVPKVTRINEDGTESVIVAEEIAQNDTIRLKTGDQIPCDGVLVSSHGFEVSEALITGESTASLRKPWERVFAGSIITSGSGILKVEKIFAESRIALMTKSIKKYSLILSPIQHAINTVIKITGYALLLIILFVVGRGLLVNESTVQIIQNIGALTSILLPQGLVLVVTLLFSYGALHLYRKNVLLQEVNATEKIGRIKNLCMDKTGTLTDNTLVVEHLFVVPDFSEEYATGSIAAYIKGTGDSSQTMEAIRGMVTKEYTGTLKGDTAFSSTRQFGAVHIEDAFGERVILAGAPDTFLPYVVTKKDRAWIQKYIDTEATIGKRLLCFMQSDTHVLPHDLSGMRLSALCIFVLNNNLREGVTEAIRFFQGRGVIVRIVSGDNPQTVHAVAVVAGVHNADAIITGAELETWTNDDFLKKVHTYRIFARIKPEQKEKIIEVLKHDGFTAMIGDGANDALAIKKADLGIAMFDGAQATRQIASVILVKNSFSDLPNGVILADSIIQNIEICASIFFNQVFLGFLFFIILAVFGYPFPFTPLNITFIDYFTIGLPVILIFYWIVRPVHTSITIENETFLRQVIPFSLVSAVPEALIVAFAFYGSLEEIREYGQGPTSLVALSFIIISVIFFIFSPSVYSGPTTKTQKKHFFWLVMFEIISVFVLIKISFVTAFYNLKAPSLPSVLELIPLIILYVIVQYVLTRGFFRLKEG